ncbi:MAG: hypothetical protein PHH00_03740 [Candidatus Nanoarchaeia archaeon]|nr:hypothetical protein [Candidatus Nanoarchaeia archaeon]
MGVLEQVTQMRRENPRISDEEIISALKNQGATPKEINDALNHAQIKRAVSDIMGDDMEAPSPGGYAEQDNDEYAREQEPQQGYAQEQVYTPQPSSYPQQEYQQNYGQDYSPQQTGTDTIVEIASQVFEEKISEISKKVDSFEEFKVLTSAKLEHLNERLKRVEMIIDKLQSAILEKIGDYGSNIESIKKEMSMMQDSFSKVIAPRTRSSEEEKSDKGKRRK